MNSRAPQFIDFPLGSVLHAEEDSADHLSELRHRLLSESSEIDYALSALTQDGNALLSAESWQTLQDFRRDSNESGAVLIRNVPIPGFLIPTPANGYGPEWPISAEFDLPLLLIARTLGDLVSYEDEKAGRIVQDIAPIAGRRTEQENSGSVWLEFHTENGFHPFPPDFVCLFALRSDHDRKAVTAAASITRALPFLSKEDIATLRQPLFRTHASASFTRGLDSRLVSPAHSVIAGAAEVPDLAVDFHATVAITDGAAAALASLRTALESVVVGSVLEAGDVLIIDNRRAVHARSGFLPRFDGNDRWLRRCSVVADIRRSRAVRENSSHLITNLPELLKSNGGSA